MMGSSQRFRHAAVGGAVGLTVTLLAALVPMFGSSAIGDVVPEVHPLTISKTAATSWVRDFDWTIDKSVSPASVTTAANSATFQYTVVATKGAAQDSGYAVSGAITIGNANILAFPLTGITDAIENNPAAASCVLDYNGAGAGVGVAPTSIAANSTLVVDYVCTFASAAAALATDSNTANVAWTDPVTGAAYNVSAHQSYAWGPPTSVTDEHVVVDDVFNGGAPEVLGTPSASQTFVYSRTVAVPASGCVDYANTATVRESDGDRTDSAAIHVCRATNAGFTRGYWTNKNGASWISANQAAVQATLAAYPNVLAGVGSSASAIASAISGSNSSGDGFQQFRAQFLSTALSVKKTPSLGNQFVSGPGGLCLSVSSWLAYGDANLAALLANRTDLLALKSLFDAINNNAAPSCIP